MAESIVRSLGHGVYHVSSESAASAREAAGQVGAVLELWTDLEEPGSYTVVLDRGLPTSKYEAAIAGDPEVASSVRRSASCSPPGSHVRSRLSEVVAACVRIVGEGFDGPSLEP